MMKRSKVIALLVFAFLSAPLSVLAEDFSIDRFSADVEVLRSGQILVEEKIEVDFLEPRHGLVRNIPVRYTDSRGITRSIRLRVRKVVDQANRPVPYKKSKQGNDLVIRIGDPDRTVTGPAIYRIIYAVDRGLLYFDDHDELYWNVTGTEWPVIPKHVSTAVSVPAPLTETRVECFTGPYGSTEKNCAQGELEGRVLVVSRDFLTVVIGWPKGYVRSPTIFDRIGWFLTDNGVVFFPLGMLALLVYVWWTRGRDVRGRKTIIAEYDPPEGMTPGEMGTLLDARVHPRDFSAAVVNLAIGGYLRIIEEEKGKIFKSKSYTLERIKSADEKLEEHEKIILERLFESGSRIELAQGKAKQAFNEFAKNLYAHLARQNYFIRNPNSVRGAFILVGGALVFVGFFLGEIIGPLGLGSFAATGVMFFAFAPIMPKKTKKGTLAYERALGFKEFLTVAEKYRIQWQEKERIFEKYLPYAMVFGVVDQWSRALADTMREPPSWYSGSFAGWNAVAFTSSLNSFTRSANSAASPAKGASAGSSGFGGGGFSGGGFGGGGGGSW